MLVRCARRIDWRELAGNGWQGHVARHLYQYQYRRLEQNRLPEAVRKEPKE
jgi:hypothetical protein